ncbi:MAG: hypothetical protein OXF84_09535 [Bacteroidetes bacterium]|nr:hypothetical protein [Bacteroidota bacterium]
MDLHEVANTLLEKHSSIDARFSEVTIIDGKYKDVQDYTRDGSTNMIISLTVSEHF